MTPGPGIEPGTHWWKASALTTTPTLLPSINEHFAFCKKGASNTFYNLLCKRTSVQGMWLTNHSSKWLCWLDSLKVSTQYVKMRRYVNSRGNPFIKCEDGDVHENVVKNVNSRFFNLFSVLFQVSYYLKCKGTLLELNSWRALSTFRKREKIFSLLEIRYFQVVAVQWRHDARAEFVVSLIMCGHTRRLPQGSPWGNSLGWVRSRF